MQVKFLSTQKIKETHLAMRGLLFLASGLVFVAGVQLFVLSEHTDKF